MVAHGRSARRWPWGRYCKRLALYISGYRSMWLLFGVQVVFFILLKKKYGLGIIVVCLALASYGLLPQEAKDRLHSLEMVLRGNPEDIDTSGVKRWDRAEKRPTVRPPPADRARVGRIGLGA